jgi:hypothetical protein
VTIELTRDLDKNLTQLTPPPPVVVSGNTIDGTEEDNHADRETFGGACAALIASRTVLTASTF